jgi:hypothetical protein
MNERPIPKKLEQLKALKRRQPIEHPKKLHIEKEIYRREAGLWGEKEIDKKLKRIDQDKYKILCDLRLPNGDGTYSQIDTLVLSTHNSLNIEGKNFAGPLYFDLKNHQFYRKNLDESIEGFSDPVSQARLHQQQLMKWFINNKLPLLPLDFFVIISNPNTVFYITPPDHPCSKKIFSIAGLTWEIDQLSETCRKEIITEKDLRKIIKALLKSNTPAPPSEILRQFGISKSDLRTGVHCPQCEFLPLIFQRGKWYCPICKKRYKDALYGSMCDYFLLYGPTITNSQFREFVHIDDPDIANRELKKLNLKAIGRTKDRVYQKNE